MLVRPRGPKPKGFLGAAKSTDKLPFRILCYSEILPENGKYYTPEETEHIGALAIQGKAIKPFGHTNMYELKGVVTSASQAEKMNIPMRHPMHEKG